MNADAILSLAYLLALVVVGWRLATLRWPLRLRVLAGLVLVLLTPALFLVPALLHPERPFADLQRAVGIGMLAAGAVALLCGATAGRLVRKRRQ
jgi:hypothetical protein